MRKLAYGLTAVTMAFASGCTTSESPALREPTPSTTPGGLSPSSRALECGFHSYSLEAAPGVTQEQACEVAKRVGSAVLKGETVPVARNFTWFERPESGATCIIQPIVVKDGGYGYIISVIENAGPRMEVHALPGHLVDDYTIQPERIQPGEGGYVSALNGQLVAREMQEIKDPAGNYVCHREFLPQ